MSRRILTRREDGSLPLAMLATIVVAGLITVVIARTIAGERAVRFDRNFGESLQIADVGISRGLFALNEGREDMLPTTASPRTETVDGITYEWWAETTGAYREWQVTSEATANGVSRRVQAIIEEVPLFFPGAFGDQLIALNGNSTKVDSYNSDPACTTLSRVCGWGNTTSDVNQYPFGTGNGSIGTNQDFDFDGTATIRPGGAFLYDWKNNPGSGITASDPFGDRCDAGGTDRCSTTYVSSVEDKLDFADTGRMAFITDKFHSSGGCKNNAVDRQIPNGELGEKKKPTTIVSYATARGLNLTNNDPTDPEFKNFYCAPSLKILGDIELADSVSVDNPVVIFVQDYLTVPQPAGGSIVGCHGADISTPCAGGRSLTPAAGRLQIYVAGIPQSGGGTAANITVAQQTQFAGVIYAPRSKCGGGAGVHIYGAIICGEMVNVGNWNFHYDDALGANGSGLFNVAFWQEVTPGS